MSGVDRLKKGALLEEFELQAENWSRGPYGAIWNEGNLRRQPTDREIAKFHQRQSGQTAPTTKKPNRYICTFITDIYKD